MGMYAAANEARRLLAAQQSIQEPVRARLVRGVLTRKYGMARTAAQCWWRVRARCALPGHRCSKQNAQIRSGNVTQQYAACATRSRACAYKELNARYVSEKKGNIRTKYQVIKRRAPEETTPAVLPSSFLWLASYPPPRLSSLQKQPAKVSFLFSCPPKERMEQITYRERR